MVPKQVSYRFPGIDYCTVSIQRGKVPIPNCHRHVTNITITNTECESIAFSLWYAQRKPKKITVQKVSQFKNYVWLIYSTSNCDQNMHWPL